MATAVGMRLNSNSRFLQGVIVPLFMLLLGVLLQLQAVAATEYTVYWSYPNYENYFSNWNKGSTYVVGDSIEFLYNAEAHNVVRVNNQQYDDCSTNAQPVADGATVFRLNEPGMYFFMCTVPGHCEAGMKLQLRVI
ncbi:hypothetical protein CY35_05G036800 [Sphagnum magellanicum]|jgi:ABC-type sugar transport system substrate-binding protein|nr:hypothetical protein CY35_05G036800 [Sphagnum magellanicum]